MKSHDPEVFEYRKLEYQGKTVFGKMVMSSFNRIEKYFTEDEACFMFIETGDFILRTPDKTLHIGAEEGLIARCGNYFFEREKQESTNDERLSFIAVYFFPEIVKPLFTAEILGQQYRKNYDASKLVVNRMLKDFKNNLSFLLDHPDVVDEQLVLTKLRELIILLSKSDEAPTVNDFLDTLFKPYEYDFKTIIERNLYVNLSLDQLAYLCDMSLATFKRKFTEFYREAPATYIMRQKLERAKKRMSIAENRISDVAYDCGFETLSTFNRNFKKHFGISPSEFRKRNA